MIKLGQKAKIIKRPNNSESGKNARVEKQGYIYALTKYLVTIMYAKDGYDMYKESINVADIIDNHIQLQVKVNKEWNIVSAKDFEILMRNA